MRVFLTIPFLRILIPFISGILLGLNFYIPFIPWTWFTLLLLLISAMKYFNRRTVVFRRTLLLMMDIFLLLYGINLVAQTDLSRQELFYGKRLTTGAEIKLIALIDDLPLEKEKSIKVSLKLLEIKADSIYRIVKGNLLGYFKKSKATRVLRPGNVLLIRAKPQEVSKPKNPFEFDYKSYLENRQVYHTIFVDSNAFFVLPGGPLLNPVWKLGLSCKEYILKELKRSALSRNSYAICAALLTGYDDEIDRSVMDAFSHSGTLHVLSVSGLHTGLIYLVLGFFFDLVDKKKKHKLLKFVFITLVLWLFALITGFSSPVLRAVIMFNLLGLGKIYFRHDSRNQMNILLVSAFILLIYNPFFISDVGFQLSYFALAGLIFFQPALSAAWRPGSYITNTTWQSIAASVAATLSTLPLTLLYFKQFPIWFFICNLVVVPATFVILLLAVLVVLHLNVAASLINYLITFLIAFIDLFNSETFGFIDMINFNISDALLLAAMTILISMAVQYRSYKLTVLSACLLIFWQVFSLLNSFRLKQSELFTSYYIRNKSVFALKNKTRVFLNEKDQSEFNFHLKPHFISFCNPEIVESNFNYLENEKNRVLILNRPGFWPTIDLNKVNVILLCNDFVLTSRDLQGFGQLKMIVSASSNNSYTNKKTGELSRKFGIDFYDTNIKGAYVFVMN